MDKPILTILVEGYAHPGENNTYLASPTASLLQFKQGNYLIDPGANREKLTTALSEKGLAPSDINAIFLSHYHPDHFLNIRLFPNTPLYDGTMLWQNDQEIAYANFWLHPEFMVLSTPGHASEQCSILVNTDNLGLVCIAQDVFWWEDGKQQTTNIESMIAYEDPFASDSTALQNSRRLVLESGADWIVPGHGKMFKNPLSK